MSRTGAKLASGVDPPFPPSLKERGGRVSRAARKNLVKEKFRAEGGAAESLEDRPPGVQRLRGCGRGGDG